MRYPPFEDPRNYVAARDTYIGQRYARNDPFPKTRKEHHVRFKRHTSKIWYAHCKCGWSGWSKFFDRLTTRAAEHARMEYWQR